MRFLVSVLVVFVCVVSVSAQQFYVPVSMGPPGVHVVPNDINNLGQIVGTYYPQLQGGTARAFMYDFQTGTFGDLGVPEGWIHSLANAINDESQIVGTLGGDSPVAVIWNQNQVEIVGGNTRSGNDINNQGMIVGDTSDLEGFYYTDSKIYYIGSLTPTSSYSGPYSSATAINNTGQIGGTSRGAGFYSDSTVAVIYENEQLVNLGTSPDVPRRFNTVTAINDFGQAVVFGTIPGTQIGYLYDYNSNSWTNLGSLGGDTYPSAINNRGVIVGSGKINSTSSLFHGFVWQDGVIRRLNDLLIPGTGFDVRNAYSINDTGQIVGTGEIKGKSGAIILQPVMQNPASFSGLNRKDNAYRRLGLWDGEKFIDLPEGFEISGSANIHVVTHGWAPGFKGDVLNEDDSFKRVWDGVENSDGDKFGEWMNTQASIFAREDPGSIVIGYSWVDQSATSSNPFAARSSRSHTDDNGALLAWLVEGIIGDEFTGNLGLFGHSHGSRVATTSALALEKAGIDVNHLTLWDAPEDSKSTAVGGKVYLQNLLDDLENDYGIGNGERDTFVENYFSQFGWSYGGDVVDVELQPEHLEGIGGIMSLKHSYPLQWYANASLITDDVAFNWFNNEPEAGTLWYQDWLDENGEVDFSKEYVLSMQTDIPITEDIYQTTPVTIPSPFWFKGEYVPEEGDFFRLKQQSPAFWYSTVVIGENDVALLFDYEFLVIGEGDQLGVWIDEELMLLLTADLIGDGEHTAVIDLSGFDPHLHFLTLAFYDQSEMDSEVRIGNFQMVYIPEPATLLFVGASVVTVYFRRK